LLVKIRDVNSLSQSGLEARILALISATELWPWPRPWCQIFGLGLQQKNQQARRDGPAVFPPLDITQNAATVSLDAASEQLPLHLCHQH